MMNMFLILLESLYYTHIGQNIFLYPTIIICQLKLLKRKEPDLLL